MNATLTILLAGLASYVLRMSLIATDRIQLGEHQRRLGELVAPAAFGALAATSLLSEVLGAGLRGGVPVVVAAAVGFAVAARTGVALTALAGLPVFWLASALLS
jgi:branched-subunit amino acid transport protein